MARAFAYDKELQLAACGLVQALHDTGNYERMLEEFPEVAAVMDRIRGGEGELGEVVIVVFDEGETIPDEEAVVQ